MLKIETKKVKDIMTEEVISVKENDSVLDAIRTLKKNKISGAPVLDEEGKLAGIISEGDILNLIEYHPFLEPFLELLEDNPDDIKETLHMARKRKVSEVMTKKVITISPDDSVSKAAKIMWEKKINRLPVVEEKKIVGIITRADILKAF